MTRYCCYQVPVNAVTAYQFKNNNNPFPLLRSVDLHALIPVCNQFLYKYALQRMSSGFFPHECDQENASFVDFSLFMTKVTQECLFHSFSQTMELCFKNMIGPQPNPLCKRTACKRTKSSKQLLRLIQAICLDLQTQTDRHTPREWLPSQTHSVSTVLSLEIFHHQKSP